MPNTTTYKTYSKNELTARLALLALGVIWGSTFVGVSSTAEFFKPAFLIFLRFSLGFLFLSLVFLPRLKNFSKKYIVAGVLTGLTTFFGYYTQTFAMTVLGGKPGRAAFLIATYCVIVPFASWFVNKNRPNKYNIIAAFMCITGIALISLPDLLSGKDKLVSFADLVTIISAFIFVGNIIVIEKLAPELDSILFTVAHFFVVAVFAFLFTFFFEDNSCTVWSKQSIVTALYLAIPCTGIALLLQTYGQKYTSASTASLFFSLESVFGMAFSVMLGCESLTLNLLFGGFLIVAAIIVTETKLNFIKPKTPAN